MRKDKANRELIRDLVLKGKTDQEIGDQVNRSKWTIRSIRIKELKLSRNSIYFQNVYRRIIWRKNHDRKIDGVLVRIPLVFSRGLFSDGETMVYKINREFPNKISIEFRKENEINVNNIRMVKKMKYAIDPNNPNQKGIKIGKDGKQYPLSQGS